jgi:hypothetical protein
MTQLSIFWSLPKLAEQSTCHAESSTDAEPLEGAVDEAGRVYKRAGFSPA